MTILHDPGNELPEVKELYAFVSVDPEGREVLCGMTTEYGWMPAITANTRVLAKMGDSLKKIMRKSDKRLRLVKFTQRVVVEDY